MSPLGSFQNNSLFSLTMDTWQDKVFFQEQEFPAGYFATELLNRKPEANNKLLIKAGELFRSLQPYAYENIWQPQIKAQALDLLPEIWTIPPFSFLDQSRDRELIEDFFSDEHRTELLEPESAWHDSFLLYFFSYVRIAQAVVNYGSVGLTFENLYLHRLKKRNETYFAYALHDCFQDKELMKAIHESELLPVENFSMEPEMHSTFVFARYPKHKTEMVFVSRLIFNQFSDFYVYDLMNGLHYGHAPHMCENCGRYFLTTNGHMPKYCDGISPQDPNLTCREMGAKIRQKEKNDQHPVYRLFNTRTNTIRKHDERGKISPELRATAIKVAEECRERALMDHTYAQDSYPKDMELENLYDAARKLL